MQRIRREPPPFRRGAVSRVERESPYLVRVTLAGPELGEFEPPLPAGSVRLLMPDEPGRELVMPVWNGNAFFHADGRRPPIRTLTPLRHDAAAGELDLEIVIHGDGPMSNWAQHARPGDPAAISGPARGYTLDHGAAAFRLAGDESALPAVRQLLAALPPTTPIDVLIEIAQPEARVDLPAPPSARVRWLERKTGAAPGAALADAVMSTPLDPATRLWAAGEAAAMQRIRRHVFQELGVPRSQAHIRGYWKHGRAGAAEDES